VADKKYLEMSREELEAESERLAKERTKIRLQQVEVDGLLDAHRAMEAANLSPDTVKQMYRIASIGSKGEAGAVKS